MTIAVLGAGMQGCCVALELAERGEDVVLIDRAASILSRTAIANEGKIHLGWMYAADPSLATARRMMTGALAFAPFLARHLGIAPADWATSIPAAYAVHRASQHSPAEVEAYFASVHAMILEASQQGAGAYFGRDLSLAPRPWSASEIDAAFDPSQVTAVFDSPEVAIDPVDLAQKLTAAVKAQPRITFWLETEVLGAAEDVSGIRVRLKTPQGEREARFEQVVNALWESRLAIDRTLGIHPGRPWLYRLKYGVGFKWPDPLPRPPSTTFISGPFGEVVSYPDATTYLTWYPACVTEMSREVAPPFWRSHPPEPERSRIADATVGAIARIVRAIAPIEGRDLEGMWVKGGPIVAWGKTDIDDPRSELHNRYDIGVHAHGRYFSIDPGKLTMAPYFAERCADLIAPARQRARA